MDYRETYDEIDRRARHVLDMIFHNDTEQCKYLFCYERQASQKLTGVLCQSYRLHRMPDLLVDS